MQRTNCQFFASVQDSVLRNYFRLGEAAHAWLSSMDVSADNALGLSGPPDPIGSLQRTTALDLSSEVPSHSEARLNVGLAVGKNFGVTSSSVVQSSLAAILRAQGMLLRDPSMFGLSQLVSLRSCLHESSLSQTMLMHRTPYRATVTVLGKSDNSR